VPRIPDRVWDVGFGVAPSRTGRMNETRVIINEDRRICIDGTPIGEPLSEDAVRVEGVAMLSWLRKNIDAIEGVVSRAKKRAVKGGLEA